MVSSSAQYVPPDGGTTPESKGVAPAAGGERRRPVQLLEPQPAARKPSRLFGMMLIDVLLATICTAITLLAATEVNILHAQGMRHLILGGSYICILLLALRGLGAYGPGKESVAAAVKSVAVASAVMYAVLATSETHIAPASFAASVALLNSVALGGWRHLQGNTAESSAKDRSRRVLVIGAGQLGQEVAERVRTRENTRAVRGFLDDRDVRAPEVLGQFSDFKKIAQAHFIDEVLIAVPMHRPGVLQIAEEARERKIEVRLVPAFLEQAGAEAEVGYVAGMPTFALYEQDSASVARFCKRVFDVVGSAALLVLISPLLLLICIAIAIDSPGPVFYCSDRIGKKGRRFCFYKFRSMVADADAMKDSLREQNERVGPFFKMENDPRVTRFGKFLRRTSLDELPQLWNVLKGDMSLVGPRPHPVDDFRRYRLEHLRRLDVTPGITGLWQVTARRDPSFERNMALDIEYINRWSLWMDFRILLKTLPAVIQGDGR